MTTLSGIDISDYQTATPPLTGLAFCIAKASEGMSAAKTYGMHVANTRKAGIVTGAYHFARNDSTGTPAQQAAFFLQTAGDVDLYAVDVEGFHAFSLAQSQSFIAVMHAAGKRIGMYGSVSGFQRAGQDWDWVAFYNPTPPTIPYDIWQYGPRRIGAVDVDGDTFAGDAVALAKLIGGSQGGPNQPGDEMAFASDPNPKLIDVPAGQPQFELDGKTSVQPDDSAYRRVLAVRARVRPAGVPHQLQRRPVQARARGSSEDLPAADRACARGARPRPVQGRLMCSRCQHAQSAHRVTDAGYSCLRCACRRSYWRET